MSNTIKKFVKYLFIIALLAGVVFLGVKLLFPTPPSTLAFEKTTTVLQNENFNINQTASDNFISRYNYMFVDEPENLLLLSQAKENIDLHLEFLNFMQKELAFAKNTAVYNSKANQLKKLEEKLATALQTSKTYIQNQFDPVYNQSTPPAKSTLKALLENIVKNNKSILASLTFYTENISAIFLDLENNFNVNNLSKKNVQIISNWLVTQNNFLNSKVENEDYNTTKGLANLNKLIVFKNANLNQAVSFSYNINKEFFNEKLQTLTKANLKELLKVIEISDMETFLNNIENEEIKTSTQALKNFILGGE